jgi:archaellum biogenesis protein FlaJ (TadC family)
MTSNIDLQALERQAFRSNYEDGLWDILLGLLLAQMMVGPILYRAGWSPILILGTLAGFVTAVVIAFKMAKRHLVLPRAGLAHFSNERDHKKKRMSVVYSISIVVGVVVFAVAVFGYQAAINQTLPPWASGGLLAIMGLFLITAVTIFSLMAYYLNYSRAYLYGWFFGLAFPLNILVDELFGITFPLGSLLFLSIMVLIGIVLFIRFLNTHPMPERDNG